MFSEIWLEYCRADPGRARCVFRTADHHRHAHELSAGWRHSPGIAYVKTVGMLGGFIGPYKMGSIKTTTDRFANKLLAVTGLLAIGKLIMMMVRTRRL